jgi:hypothetical protein
LFTSTTMRNSSGEVITSLLAQLVNQRPGLPPSLRQEYDAWRNGGHKNRPSDNRFVELLVECMSGFPKVFVVLDAFDELMREEREKLIVSLQALCKSKLNLFLTTRSPLAAFLQRSFPTLAQLEINARDDDIHRYLMERLSTISLHVKLKEFISVTLLKGAQGKYVAYYFFF